MKKKDFISILLVILLTIFALLPLFRPGFYPMHDNEQVGRLYDLDLAIKAGHIPPRIAPNLGFGYGYPFFNFYPSFVYYIAEIFVLMGFSYIVSTKIMIVLGFVLAAVCMYFLSKQFFGRVGGIVSAVAYTYTPYHAVDVYVRGALPEFWSFVFIPAIFLFLLKLKQNLSFIYVILTAISISFLILTHNLVAFMSAPFLAVFILFLIWQSKEKKKFLILSIVSILLGFGLSAFYWLPSYFEKQYTMVDLLTTELANYAIHFVHPRQLWDSPWGYGGSILGPYDGITFQIGQLHIIVSLLILTLSLFLLKKKDKKYKVLLLFFVLLIFSIFMTTRFSQFIWDHVQQLWYIQFPWRYLVFSAFTSSLLVGGMVFFPVVKNNGKIIVAGLLIIVIIWMNKGYFVPEHYSEELTDSNYTNAEVIRYETSRLAAEYVPKGIATRKTDINTTVVDINKEDIAKTDYKVITGKMAVTVLESIPQRKRFQIDAKTSGELQINTFSFPGWKVFIDGKEISYKDDNKLKLITMSIPPGAHEVSVILTDTPARTLGNLLSIASIVIMLSIFVFYSFTIQYKHDYD